MDIFNILEMVGGLCLFLFGMSVMGQALEKSAGGKLRSLLSKMTSTKMTGFLRGRDRHLSHKIKLKIAESGR